ncbi:DUF4247 domain-containing protein [Paenibacillus sp. MZ04-78.2]|uniref:DUF4247 domain-containing protein n=1 Tax=Paenibacillus sp. MZ04-78.2 TaxID=2962034 RepID=UPI0020B84600|nr:DUF4247 domain-containing protein [Paenibacillus sp. MZ04-78.2]MCP3772067.1 DUF4247 domain-containing protein [Paenibacillus sp. MZ04-78.2]
MINKLSKWIAILLVFTLLAACGDAGNYIKDNYSLIDVQGQGKSTAKIYSVAGKNVPTVAKEIANKEKPTEMSKDSEERMFLVYDNKIINVQKDTNTEGNILVEVDSIQYAKENYNSSFLQGYVAATLLQSLFGGGWFNNNSRGSDSDYKGYTSSKRYNDYGKYQSTPYPGSTDSTTKPQPSTSGRKGSFTTTPSNPQTTTPPNNKPTVGDSARKNDGSKPTYKTPSGSSKPSTGSRSGSFKRK